MAIPFPPGDRAEIDELRARLEESEETLRAIRYGEVDALVVQGPEGEQVYTLRTAERPYRILIEAMQEGAATLDEGGVILFCNHRFADMVALPLESLVGVSAASFFDADHQSAFASLLRDSGRLPATLTRADGSLLDAYVSVVAFADGAATRHAMILTDVTDLLDARRRQDTAERENRAKDEFLAMLGHELRNPLAAIAGAAAVLDSAGRHDHLSTRARDIIRRQVGQLARLVDDLLDVGRVVTGKIKLSPVPVDLAAAVSAVVPALAASHGSAVPVEVACAPVWVHADPVRIEQIVGNLVGNALKFTPSTGHVYVDVRECDGVAILEVRDTGMGIDPTLLPQVFDLFVQGRTTLDRGTSGLGIGLTLVRRLAELHHGTITASSDGEGHGATFVVRLPAIPAPVIADVPRGQEPSARRRVLVIEDNDDAREAVVMMLQLGGHEVFGAREGSTGLALFRERQPDVALIDIGLPDMDGYEICSPHPTRANGPPPAPDCALRLRIARGSRACHGGRFRPSPHQAGLCRRPRAGVVADRAPRTPGAQSRLIGTRGVV